MECIFGHPSLSIFEWCELVRMLGCTKNFHMGIRLSFWQLQLWKLNWSALIAQSFMFWVSLIKMVWKSRVQKRQQNVNFAYHKYKVHNMEDGGVDRTIICYQQHHTIGPNGTLFFFFNFFSFWLIKTSNTDEFS